jgi:hypothetical protein
MANFAVMSPGNYHLADSYTNPPYYNRKYQNNYAPFKTIRWKTAVVNERRVYAGNVSITTNDGVIKLLPDTIFKSDLGKFDRFTERGRLEVATGDGEDIVVLKTYADRILEFKDKTLHIINVSGGKEFLEDSLKYKGVLNPQAAAYTDMGVAWVNKSGAFMYDGKNVRNLIEIGAKRKILPKTWSDFITNETQVGYFPSKKQIMIIRGYNISNNSYDGDMYLFDLVTQSWVLVPNRFQVFSVGNQTNIINYPYSYKDELIFGEQDTYIDTPVIKVYYWDDTAATGAVDLQTKDVDFRQPGVQKLVSKIYVTSKEADGLSLYASTNGAQDWAGTYDSSNNPNAVSLSSPTMNTGANWGVTSHLVTGRNPEVYSLQLKIAGSTTNSAFSINDISIIYRMKGAR